MTAVRKRRGARAAAFRVGTAGWALPREHRARFPEEGTNLQRYAGLLPAAEINSSFYRPHKPAIYERWAAGVPAGFRFSVKLPKAITHLARLVETGPALDDFLAQAGALGDRLGCLLVQLPPSLAFDAAVATRFLGTLRERYTGGVALEPRHASWFEEAAERALRDHAAARVAADPAKVPAASEPGGHDALVYLRLHGSPRMYYSSYEDTYLDVLATRLRAAAAAGADAWCIFDNTAHGHATGNALALLDRVAPRTPRNTRNA